MATDSDVGISSLDAGHEGLLHVVQADHFGKRLATGGSDGRVLVWDRQPPVLRATLKGHTGPVWTLSWSHPSPTESTIASGGQDCSVRIWRCVEGDGAAWCEVYRYEAKDAIMAIAFGPWEYELQLAVASGDGAVFVLSDIAGTEKDGEPRTRTEKENKEIVGNQLGGAFAVCWGPSAEPPLNEEYLEAAATKKLTVAPRRLVTGGADNRVRIWRHDKQTNSWAEEYFFPADDHADSVRDVAWRPNAGIPSNTIAACADDGSVVIWTQATAGQPWQRQMKEKLDDAAWQCSWSMTGSILAVSTSGNEVRAYEEFGDGKWKAVDVSAIPQGDVEKKG